MGEELDGATSSGSSTGERRVRFATSPNAIQDRNVSGASLNNLSPDQVRHQVL